MGGRAWGYGAVVGGRGGYGGHFRGEGSGGGGDSGWAAVTLIVFELSRSEATPAKLAGVGSSAAEMSRDFLPAEALLLFKLLQEDIVLRIPGHRSTRSLGPGRDES